MDAIISDEIRELWSALPRRARLAQVLMVLSGVDKSRNPSADTLLAVDEGVGAFHGLPLLGTSFSDRLELATRANAVLHARGLETYGLAPLIGGNIECGISYTVGRGGSDVPYHKTLGLLGDDAAFRAGDQIGRDLAAAGYDWCLGPVIDVRVQPDDPVIGVRAFGSDPGRVGALGAAYIRGVQAHGVWACAKHFPGHGDSPTDSHFDRPIVRRTPEDHRDVHLTPYRDAIDAGVASVMTAHMIFPDLGIDDLTTFSPAVNRDLLRTELGFDRVVVSDSLRMHAVSKEMDRATAVIRSLNGGCDVANIKCPPGAVPQLLDDLEAAHAAGAVTDDVLLNAFARIRSQRAQNPAEVTRPPRPITVAELREHVLVTNLDQPPIPAKRGDVVAVHLASRVAGETGEPLQTALDDVGDLLGLRLVCVMDDDPAPPEAAGHVLLMRSQGHISDGDEKLLRRATACAAPATVLAAGPRETHRRLTTGLRTAGLPCIDVFGLLSRPSAAAALAALVEFNA